MPDYSLGRPLPLWPICLLLYATFSFGAPKPGVPSDNTPRIQKMRILMGHTICQAIYNDFM